MTEWFYSKKELQQGPVPEDELLARIRSGNIEGTDLVWKEGMADWKPVSQIPELKETAGQIASPSEMPIVQNFPPSGSPGNVAMRQPSAEQAPPFIPDVPSYMVPSIIALVVSCLSMVLTCLPIGLPFAIVAVVYGTKVDSLRVQGNYIAAEAASKSAKIWMILGYVMAGLPLLGLLGFVFFAIFSSP